jgi:ubiquinone/menaquinone biosynthesis C-methylase UbiE
MPNPLKFIPMILEQRGPQLLERIPEPGDSIITGDVHDVEEYDQVMNTKLVIAYAVGLEAIHRARPGTESTGGQAVDLACGPGHYTQCLHEHLKYDQVTGLDLAPGMIRAARKNARERRLDTRLHFRVCDVTDLKDYDDDRFDLSSFTDAAHHMPDLETVRKVVAEMDRVTRPDGLVMLMDLARLRTSTLTETYVNLLGQDYVERGLPNFFRQFRDSMYAAWTHKELKSAIPRATSRVWYHLVPKVLPTLQIIFGLPVGRQKLFLRKGLPWKPRDCPVPRDLRMEWTLARFSLFSAR